MRILEFKLTFVFRIPNIDKSFFFFFKSTMFTIASMILDNEPAPITVVANIYRRYDMDSLSALLVLCEGGPMVIYKQHVTRTLMFSLILA